MRPDQPLRRGTRVAYIGEPVFDMIIRQGDTGPVVKVDGDWVFVLWSCGVHSVPARNLRRQSIARPRHLKPNPDDPVWQLVGDLLPPRPDGRDRDPYLEQGSHPDVVERIWDVLGGVLPAPCRAQANGRPVLAHPRNHIIFAKAHGTAYALRLAPDDYEQALARGAQTVWKWTGGSTTDLLSIVGTGWIWGRWDAVEAGWMARSFADLGSV